MPEKDAVTSYFDDVPPRRPPIVGVAELAQMFDVSPQRADQLSHGYGFPKPLAFLAAGRFWRTAQVLRWAEDNGREVAEPPE